MNRKSILFSVLGGFFLTNALVAELIGGKIIICVGDEGTRFGPLGPFAMSVGIFPWPVVFLTTDIINEYFGRRGVRRLTWLAIGMISYAFVVLALTRIPNSASFSGIDNAAYDKVFGQSQWIIVASLLAFAVSQLVDVTIFHLFRRRTGKTMLWLRSTGSTVVSQFIDSVIVLYIGLAIPNHWTFAQFAGTAATNYTVKLIIAVGLTPLIYLGHWGVERFLGKDLAEEIAEKAARASEGDPLAITES